MDKGSWKQGLLTFGCFAAIGAAHWAGKEEGTLVTCVLAYLMYLRQPPAGGPPPAVKAIAGTFLGLALGHSIAACS